MIKQLKAVIFLNNKMVAQNGTIGIIGGGQLGQMLVLSAKEMGLKTVILDPDPTCPAGQASDEQIVAPYDDFSALEKLAKRVDVMTYEFENVDLEALEHLTDAKLLPQGTRLLKITKNRLAEKTFLHESGLKTAPFEAVKNKVELKQAVAKLGMPSILKTCEGGYDGKAQVTLKQSADLLEAEKLLQQGPCILEGFVDFSMECSVMVARNVSGATTVFPVSENIHRNHILHESIIPARMDEHLQHKAQALALKIAESLDLHGILGVEFFVGKDQEIYVNELAPRPHNSGHFSIEACNFSQFDIHNRAILNWPLPQIELLRPAVMVNVLGQHKAGSEALIAQKPQWHFHDYGKKDVRHDRKMGHITILTNDLPTTLAEITATKVWD
ncbi:5-(carboxyamino)imidazole ribonucleotide synthase [Ligilactobacillus apodemi]|uniref:5-(carboxyamino)imidazole ribonucleotide synthase n=1 Tax=Ligilactobacillus apodemi TaxID=307126 RepID=UPI00214C6DEF|nr:5-(carboxyamino)imidazole ribonucleotide synthase [Ligilactobacillus apodemi]MCR1900416.1 5-(carboxyamino)imidazole ribonucleotide synthase [Ligilactobacillus apodemi]